MAIGVRGRGALIVLPVAGQLIALAGVGVLAPRHISKMSAPTLIELTVAVGTGATALLVVAALRSRGRVRASWAALALACAGWSLALIGDLLAWPAPLVWGWLRSAACLAVTLAVLVAPGVRRSARDWGLLLLDGWLVGVSAFLIGWVALRLTTSSLSAGYVPAALYWVPLDLVIASTVTGLAIRATGPRAPLALIVLGALLTVTSDTTWALTARRGEITPFGVLEWLIALTALGSGTLTRGLDLWSTTRPVPGRGAGRAQPPLTRLAQMAMVPGLLAAALPGADAMTFAAAASLILGLAVEVALTRRQHDELWQALQAQARRMEQLLQDSRDAILRLNRDGRIEFANAAVAEVFGHPPGTLVGTSWYDLMLPDDRAAAARHLDRLTGDGTDIDTASCRIAARFRHGDGPWRELESTVSRSGEDGSGYTLSVRDVSERSRMEADLRRQASTDGLTGLFNRQAFVTLLQERLSRGDTHLLFLDLDGFKSVNDTDGHLAGDRLLREVADSLRAELRPDDIAARLGGDEFAVLPAVRNLDGTRALAERLVHRVSALSDRHGSRIGASIGVTDGRHDDAEALIRRADLAMYQAKASGGRQFVVLADEHGRTAAPPVRSPVLPPGTPPATPSARVVDLAGLDAPSESKRA
jgi:diguanylate cyclase (GGDEF)-like protein/PAS domain S-box-containing protein